MEGTEMVMPGDNATLDISLIGDIVVEQGQRFALREGGRTVGAGVVSKLLDSLTEQERLDINKKVSGKPSKKK